MSNNSNNPFQDLFQKIYEDLKSKDPNSIIITEPIIMQGGDPSFYEKDNNKPKYIVPKNIDFNFDVINTDYDLKEFTKSLKSSKYLNYGILLYGVSGSGKSYFGEYLAQELNMPFIKKRASDLIDRYVGQTEMNIKKAFAEAVEHKAILLFDEADSFLFDRTNAERMYEVTHVNELLTQMENHPYPFIMTTNLKTKIDNASLRRFVFKIKYSYMTKDQLKAGIHHYFNKELSDNQLNSFEYLTIGDLKTVSKKLTILKNNKYSSKCLYEYLKKEQDEKEIFEPNTLVL